MIDPIRDGRHYDTLKSQDDVPFYLSQAKQASGPVLEIGCGTGRVALALAAEGVDITGLDISASMLEEAKRKAHEKGLTIRWVEADGRSFDLSREFSLVIVPFNSLQFFRDASSQRQLFGCVKKHLAEAGRFVFDVFNPQVAFLASDPNTRFKRAEYDDPDGGGRVVLEESREYLPARQVVKSTRYYHIGSERDRWVRTLELRCFFPCDLDLLVEHHGFRIEERLGDFGGAPFSDDSPKQIVICSVAP